MTSAIFGHRLPLTEEEFLAIGETSEHYYAAAGIPWYLLVEQDTGTLHLYELVGRQYREHSVTRPGEVLRLTDPVDATIAPEALLPPR